MEIGLFVVDALAVLAVIISVVFMVKTYIMTRAAGLGFLAMGFIWAVVVRIFIAAGDNFVYIHSREFVTPVFFFYAIGSVLLFCSLANFYRQEKQHFFCKWCETLGRCMGRKKAEKDD